MAVGGLAQAKDKTNPTEKYVRASTDLGWGADGGSAGDYVANEAETDLLNELRQRYDADSKDANGYTQHRQWWVNVAFYAGLQYVRWNDAIGALEDQPAPKWRRRHIANRIMPMVLRNHAKLTSDNVDLRSVPTSSDSQSLNGSRLAEQLLEHLKSVSGFERSRADSILWSEICGSGFQKLVWEPGEGPTTTIVDAEKNTKRTMKIGEMRWDTPTPFSIRVPLRTTELEEMPWIAQETVRPYEYICERWPEKAKFITPNEAKGVNNYMEDRIKSITGIFGATVNVSRTDGTRGYVRIVEMWSRPTEKYKHGFQIIACQGVILEYQTPNPYSEFGIYLPFLHRRYIKIPGRFFGLGLVEPLIPPQQEYNTIRSIISENMILTSRPKWIVPKGSGIPKAAFTSAPGEIIEYNPTLPKPEALSIPPLAPYIIEHAEMCLREMADIAAQQDVTQAKSPASVRSGMQVSLLQQQDLAVIATPRKFNWDADREAADMMVILAREKYIEPRLIAIVGKDKQFEIKDFTGADLVGHSTFKIYAESGILDSKAARQQTILDFVELGVLNPADRREKIATLKMLDLGDVKQFVEDSLADERFAELENSMFTRTQGDPEGMPAMWDAREFDDHEVHLEKHNTYRKSIQYVQLPDQQRAEFDAHCATHQMFLQQMMQQEQAQTMAQRGGPGEKGKPSAKKQGGGGSGGGSSGKQGGGSSGGDADGDGE